MIRFEVIDATFNLRHKNAIKNWIKEIIVQQNRVPGDINYIFASDAYVLDVNRRYLGHDYYTDIITFDTSDYQSQDSVVDHDAGNFPAGIPKVSADIVISLDTVLANSAEFAPDFSTELYRVMIHGILHLTGYDDLVQSDADRMHAAEDAALAVLSACKVPFDQKYGNVVGK